MHISWVIIKLLFLVLWVKIGVWLFSLHWGIGVAWIILLAGFWALDFRRQIEIYRCLRAIKKELPDGLQKKNLCRQLEAERSRFTFWWWLFREAWNGWGPPKRIQNGELMDIGPSWVRESIQRTLRLTEQKLFPFILTGFLLPIEREIRKAVEQNQVFAGLELGCGQAGFIGKLAEYCSENKIPAVFVGLDIESSAIQGAQEWLERKGFMVRIHKGVFTEDEMETLAWDSIVKKQPIICLIQADVRNLDRIFEPGVIFDTTWMHHFMHHLPNHFASELINKIQRIAAKWYILEEFRSWLPLFLIHIFIWHFPCHLETAINSILAEKTADEWVAEYGNEIVVTGKGFLAFISNRK